MRIKRKAFADTARCAACGACVQVCPRDAIEIWKGCFAVVEPDRCVGCGKCAGICPAGALTLREGGDQL